MGSQMNPNDFTQRIKRTNECRVSGNGAPVWAMYAHNVHVMDLARISDRSQLTVRTKEFRIQYVNTVAAPGRSRLTALTITSRISELKLCQA